MRNRIRTIVIEHEPVFRAQLVAMLKKNIGLEVIATCRNPLAASKIINENKIDRLYGCRRWMELLFSIP